MLEGIEGIVRISFNERTGTFLDEKNQEFFGVRVSKLIEGKTSGCFPDAEAARKGILNTLLVVGKKVYQADAYELAALYTKREDWGGEREERRYSAAGAAIFYKTKP